MIEFFRLIISTLVCVGPMELVLKREMNKESFLSHGENTTLHVYGMFVRASDPTVLMVSDFNNRKVMQLQMGTLQLQSIYANEEAHWLVSNVVEIDEQTLIVCEWNLSILFAYGQIIIKFLNHLAWTLFKVTSFYSNAHI